MKLVLIGRRGHWGYVFQSLADVPEVELAAISSGCEDDPASMLQVCKERGYSPKVYADYIEMLDTEKPDIVSIDGPFHKHAEMCVEALNRNINVFCEKPIALTLESLADIEKALARSKGKLISMVALRYEPAFFTAHKLVEAGAIGKVKLIQTQKSYKVGTRPEFYKKRATYGGTIGWVGSHALDWTLWFAGSEFASVWATQTREDNFNNGEMEIAAQCLFKMKNGVLAEASIEFLRPMAASTHGDDRTRVAGTKGVIEVRGGKVILIDAEGEREVELPEKPEKRIFSDFCNELLGKGKCIVDARQTIHLTKACLCAQIAADENRIVTL